MDAKIFTCFSCGFKSRDIFDFWSRYKKKSLEESIKEIGSLGFFDESVMNSLNIKEKERSEEGSSFFLKIVSNIYKNNLFTLKGEKVLNYLIEKRGIQFDSIESFSLGCSIGFSQITSIFFNEGNSKFRTEEILSSNIVKLTENGFRDFFVGMRLIIPVENENGEVVSFASRSIDGERVESKYLYLPGYTGYQKSSILYNYHEAKISNENECYLVEGFFDVISLTSIGKKNCVGILGTNLSEKQIRLIKRLKKRVILFLDGDKSGREATISLSVKLINEVIDFEVLHGYDGDPDEILRKKGINKLLEVIGNREDPYSHIINHYFSEMMLKDNPQRIGVFIGEIARIFQKSKFFEKKFIIEKISTLTSWEVKDIEKFFIKYNFPNFEKNLLMRNYCFRIIERYEKYLLKICLRSRINWVKIVISDYFFLNEKNRSRYLSICRAYYESPFKEKIESSDYSSNGTFLSAWAGVDVDSILKKISNIKRFISNYE